jgi:hypothetical protein
MAYYLAIKSYEVVTLATRWMDLDYKLSDTKATLHDWAHMKYSDQTNALRQNTDWWMPGAGRRIEK